VLQVPNVAESRQRPSPAVQTWGLHAPEAGSHAFPLPQLTALYRVPLGSHTSELDTLAQRLLPGAQTIRAHAVPTQVSPVAHAA
jgi:hypothetical protein